MAGLARSCSRMTVPSLRPAAATVITPQMSVAVLRRRRARPARLRYARAARRSCAGRGARGLGPGVGVGGIVGDGHLVGVGDRRLAAEHAALVDRDAWRCPARGAGRRRASGSCAAVTPSGIVAVAVGRPRAGDDRRIDRGAAPCRRRASGAGERRPSAAGRGAARRHRSGPARRAATPARRSAGGASHSSDG